MKIVKWFCRQPSYNQSASAIIIYREVLNKSGDDIPLKPDEKPPHCEEFWVDAVRPLHTPEVEPIGTMKKTP